MSRVVSHHRRLLRICEVADELGAPKSAGHASGSPDRTAAWFPTRRQRVATRAMRGQRAGALAADRASPVYPVRVSTRRGESRAAEGERVAERLRHDTRHGTRHDTRHGTRHDTGHDTRHDTGHDAGHDTGHEEHTADGRGERCVHKGPTACTPHGVRVAGAPRRRLPLRRLSQCRLPQCRLPQCRPPQCRLPLCRPAPRTESRESPRRPRHGPPAPSPARHAL